MKKILLIEDDKDLGTIIKSALSMQYDVTSSSTIADSLALIDKHFFDLVLIDRILPDGDALEVISYLHDCCFKTKIITISSLYQINEKIKGLESGADDYLCKPFSLSELKLKVEKYSHYEKRKDASHFNTSNFEFYPDSGEVKSKTLTIKLRKKESQILACLCRYKNRVVSRDLLIDEVWSLEDIVPTQTTLDVYIRRLRVLLREHGKLIETKRGFGYQLNDF